MSAWMDLVKKLSKENPGKPLGAILPLAKKIYRKSKDTVVSAVTQKARKTGRRTVGKRRTQNKRRM
jgi:hypothetical protein